MNLSVIVPGIRPQNWLELYYSVGRSFSKKWEIIFIGPYPPPQSLNFENVRFIKSFASPIVCQQMGLLESKGVLVTWAADDGYFLEGALDIAYNKIRINLDSLVMGKYIEGNNDGAMNMLHNKYYILNNHDGSRLPTMDKKYWMLNVGLVPRHFLINIGGWDCRFEVCPMAYNDLAIRLQNQGVPFIVQDEVMYQCAHTPGTKGDHAPIHHAQIDHDQPLFNKIYKNPDSINRIKIDIHNYISQPEIWKRRFS